MTSSRQGGPSQGRGNPSDQASDQRLALLSATLSSQIIPRLLQAHIHGDSAADGTPNYSAQTGRPISSADVKDLVRMVLLPDDHAARASVEAMRLRGIPVETLFIDLLALAARHLGELWEEDLCNFADVTVGVGRLQQAMRDAKWSAGPRAGTPIFSLAAVLALMVFFALCSQCGPTVATLAQETGGWRWAVGSFLYMTALAWIVAALVYQVVSRLAPPA